MRELNILLGDSSEESSLECEESDMGFGKTPHSGSSIVNAAALIGLILVSSLLAGGLLMDETTRSFLGVSF